MLKKRRWKKWRWITLGTGAILLRWLLGFFPELTEVLYSNGLFVLIRWTIDHLLGWLPFPTALLLLVILLYLQIRSGWKRRKKHGSKPRNSWKRRFARWGFGGIRFMGKVVFFFLFLWGFNYAREPLEDHCGLKVKALSLQQLKALAPATAAWVNEARQHIPGITDGALTADFLPGNLETTMRHHLEAALADLGYRPHGNVRCRQIRPEGFLRSIGIQGIYFPFTGEGYVDASLHPIALPFTMAHEMSHGYGFTAEGTANFLALLACERSENPMIRYSGRSVFFQYLRSELRALDLGFYTTCVNGLPPGIANDRKAIIANAKAHASLIPGMAGTVNDFYLKTQGVEEGTKSYDRLVNLTVAWFGKRGWPKHIPELDFE